MSNIVNLIDDYGLLCAIAAEIEIKKKDMKAQLEALGEGAHEGTFFRVTITKCTKETLNMEAVKAKLSRQFIQANTRETNYFLIRAGARNGAGIIHGAGIIRTSDGGS